jgi:Tfp pilus assembly protein FimT
MRLETGSGMASAADRRETGYTLLELLTVLGMVAVAAAVAWPCAADLLQRAELSASTRALLADIRWARTAAQTQGRVFEMRFDPPRSLYTIGRVSGPPQRLAQLPGTLTFGSPVDSEADGVTFRDNAITFSPRASLQNSFGSVVLHTRTGLARKITVNIAGYASVTVWDGAQWR